MENSEYALQPLISNVAQADTSEEQTRSWRICFYLSSKNLFQILEN